MSNPAIKAAPVNIAKEIVRPGEKAGFWIRFAAFGVDSFIVLPAYFLLSYLYHFLTSKPMGIDYGFPFVFLLLYEGLLTGHKGYTLGKRLFHIKVVCLKGKKLGIGRALLREVIGKPINVLWIILQIVSSLPGGHRSPDPVSWIQDEIARTKVVVTERYEAIRTSAAWWLLEFLPILGSVLGFLFLWRKDRRKAKAIFWGGLFMYAIITPVVIILVMLFV